MANELQSVLDEIKLEKDTKLLPENIKKGISLLGVEGDLEGGNPNDALVYSTKAELEADINNDDIPLGKKAIVYGVELLDTIEVGTGISVAKSVEKNFTLDTAITEAISMGIYDYEVEGSIYMEIDSTHCLLRCGSEYSAGGIHYLGYWTSEDGINYVGQTEYTYEDWMMMEQVTVTITYGETSFSTMRYNEDEKTDDNAFLYDLLKQLVVFGITKYNGIYEYTDGNYMPFLGKYAYKAELVKNESYYDVKNNDNGEWINVRNLGKKIIQLFTDNEIELASTEVIVVLNDYDDLGVNTCQVYVPSGKYTKYRSNIIVFTSLNEYYIGKDDSSLDGLDSCYVYTCDFVNKTISSSTLSAKIVSTTDYSGDTETKPIIDKNFYNDKIININLDTTTPDNHNVSSIGYYNTYGYRLNYGQELFSLMNDGREFNPSTTQFTMSTSEQENMIGSYTVLGKDGECVSTNKWPNHLWDEDWRRLLPIMYFDNSELRQDISYNADYVLPAKSTIEANKVICKFTYKKNNDLIHKFIHENDGYTQFGYRSNDAELVYNSEDTVDFSVIRFADNIVHKQILEDNINIGLTNKFTWCKWNEETKTVLDVKSNYTIYSGESSQGASAEKTQKHDDTYYVAVGGGYNGAPEWCFGVTNIKDGSLVDSFTIDADGLMGSGMGGQSFPTFWFTENAVPSLSTMQGYGGWIAGSSGSRTAKVYKIVNGKLSVVYTGPTSYNTSIYGRDPDKTVIIGTKSSSSASYVYNIVLPAAFAKTVYKPTSKRMPDGTTAYCYYKTQMEEYIEDELYCIWNNAEVKYNTLEIPDMPIVITIDGVDYKNPGENSFISNYAGKLIRIEDNVEVEIATPILTAGTLTSINSYQYKAENSYNLSSSGFKLTNKIYTACEISNISTENDISAYDMLVTATADPEQNQIYTSYVYKLSADNLDLILKLDTNYEGTISPSEYDTALDTTSEILGE